MKGLVKGISCLYATMVNYLRMYNIQLEEWKLFILDPGSFLHQNITLDVGMKPTSYSPLAQLMQQCGSRFQISRDRRSHLSAMRECAYGAPLLMILNDANLSYHHHHSDLGYHAILTEKRQDNRFRVYDFQIYDRVGNVFIGFSEFSEDLLLDPLLTTVRIHPLKWPPAISYIETTVNFLQQFLNLSTAHQGFPFVYQTLYSFMLQNAREKNYNRLIFFIKVNFIPFLQYLIQILWSRTFAGIFTNEDRMALNGSIDKLIDRVNTFVGILLYLQKQSAADADFIVLNRVETILDVLQNILTQLVANMINCQKGK